MFNVLTLLNLGGSTKAWDAYFSSLSSTVSTSAVISSSSSKEAMIFAGAVASKLPRRHCVRSIYLSTARHAKRKLHASHSLAFLKGTNFHHNASVSLFVEYFHLLLARITSTKTKLQFAFILLTHKRFCQCSEDVSKNRHLLTSKKIGLRTVWIETFRLQGSKSKK